MNKKTVIQDTADVTLTEISTGKVIFNGEATLASVTGSLEETDLYGGIGNKKLYRLRTQKDVNLAMQSAFSSLDYWAMTQGVEVDASGTATITKNEFLTVTENATTAGQLEVVISDLTFNGAGVLVDLDGDQEPLTFNSGVAIIPVGSVAVKGDEVQVFYETVVNGNSVKIDADKFSTAYKCEMKTIAYDPDTSTVYSDIYFIFPKVIPTGEFEISLENGQAYSPQINFSVLTPKNSSELGEIIEVVRP